MHEQWRPRLALVVAASGRKEPCPEESIDLVIQLGWMGGRKCRNCLEWMQMHGALSRCSSENARLHGLNGNVRYPKGTFWALPFGCHAILT